MKKLILLALMLVGVFAKGQVIWSGSPDFTLTVSGTSYFVIEEIELPSYPPPYPLVSTSLRQQLNHDFPPGGETTSEPIPENAIYGSWAPTPANHISFLRAAHGEDYVDNWNSFTQLANYYDPITGIELGTATRTVEMEVRTTTGFTGREIPGGVDHVVGREYKEVAVDINNDGDRVDQVEFDISTGHYRVPGQGWVDSWSKAVNVRLVRNFNVFRVRQNDGSGFEYTDYYVIGQISNTLDLNSLPLLHHWQYNAVINHAETAIVYRQHDFSEVGPIHRTITIVARKRIELHPNTHLNRIRTQWTTTHGPQWNPTPRATGGRISIGYMPSNRADDDPRIHNTEWQVPGIETAFEWRTPSSAGPSYPTFRSDWNGDGDHVDEISRYTLDGNPIHESIPFPCHNCHRDFGNFVSPEGFTTGRWFVSDDRD